MYVYTWVRYAQKQKIGKGKWQLNNTFGLWQKEKLSNFSKARRWRRGVGVYLYILVSSHN